MNNVKKIFSFLNDCTFYYHCNFERNFELNKSRKLFIYFISDRDLVSEIDCIRSLFVLNYLSLIVLNTVVENTVEKVINLELLFYKNYHQNCSIETNIENNVINILKNLLVILRRFKKKRKNTLSALEENWFCFNEIESILWS